MQKLSADDEQSLLLQAELDSLRERFTSLQMLQREFKVGLQTLRQRYSAECARREGIEAREKAAREERRQERAKEAEMSAAKISELRTEVQSLRLQLHKEKDQSVVLSSELSSLRLERDEIMSRCESLSGTVEEQNRKMEVVQSAHAEEVEGLRAELARSRSEQEAAAAKMRQALVEVKQYSEHVLTQEANCKAMLLRQNILGKQMVDLREEHAMLSEIASNRKVEFLKRMRNEVSRKVAESGAVLNSGLDVSEYDANESRKPVAETLQELSRVREKLRSVEYDRERLRTSLAKVRAAMGARKPECSICFRMKMRRSSRRWAHLSLCLQNAFGISSQRSHLCGKRLLRKMS